MRSSGSILARQRLRGPKLGIAGNAEANEGCPDLGTILNGSAILLFDHKRSTLGDWLVDSPFPTAHKSSFTASFISIKELAPLASKWVSQIRKTEKGVTAVILFQEGLSAVGADVALLKLWTCIELLCSTDDEREVLEKAKNRAASIFAKHEDAARQHLEFISNARHSVVHQGNGGHVLLAAQWASTYAGELIGFFAFNTHGLTKHKEILDYLSTPTSVEKLRQIVKAHSRRLRAARGK